MTARLSSDLPALSSNSAIAARVSAFGTLISKGNAFSSATQIRSSRIASDTDKPISARALAALYLTRRAMLGRTTVSEAIDALFV
jgi:hypothetical protein